jgi:asparagine N-glycosylation enzyme membrane subunit Stt3
LNREEVMHMKRIIVNFTLGCFLLIISAVFTRFGMLTVAALCIGYGISSIAWALLERVSKRWFHDTLLMAGLLFIIVPLTLTLKTGSSAWITAVCIVIGLVLIAVSFFKNKGRQSKVES